ncbi:MAG: hypothetical protein RLZZ70_592 [Candidatus Parcubacteria bacterium]
MNRAANDEKSTEDFFKRHLRGLCKDPNLTFDCDNPEAVQAEYQFIKKCYANGLEILTNVEPGYKEACIALFRKRQQLMDPYELQLSFWGNIRSILPRWFDYYDDVELVISTFEGASSNAPT